MLSVAIAFQENFDNHQVVFGSGDDAVYTPAITLWALISQVFFAAEQRSCKAAVLRGCLAVGRRIWSRPTQLELCDHVTIIGNELGCSARPSVLRPNSQHWGRRLPQSETVGHRPGTVEPRKNKRRPKILALMKKPRPEYQAELSATAT